MRYPISWDGNMKNHADLRTLSGWWFQPLWKNISQCQLGQLGLLFPIYGKINKIHVPNHQPSVHWAQSLTHPDWTKHGRVFVPFIMLVCLWTPQSAMLQWPGGDLYLNPKRIMLVKISTGSFWTFIHIAMGFTVYIFDYWLIPIKHH